MIVSIVVTYNPQVPPSNLIETLRRHSEVLVADNSTESGLMGDLRSWLEANHIRFLPMGGNAGIAAAQNRAIQESRLLGASGVIFFDQDSLVDDVALECLVKMINKKNSTVFCLKPGHYNLDNEDVDIFPIREMMSSGSGFQISVIDRVGYFESGLFIDCVDFEWGWRAIGKGIPIMMLSKGAFDHITGRSGISFFGLSARFDAPIRNYYQFRNIITMMMRGYVPLYWKISQFFRSVGKLVLLAICQHDRQIRIRFIWQGVLDGTKGHLGPYRTTKSNHEKS